MDVTMAFDANSIQYAEQESLKANVQVLGETLAEAMDGQDGVLQSRVYRQAFELGVPIDSVIRSANSRRANREQDILERTNKEAARRLKEQFGIGR